jgi:hypothetical protein
MKNERLTPSPPLSALLTPPDLCHLPALLILLDLEPVRPLLVACYPSKRRGGRPPYDPVVLLRDLLAMYFAKYTSFNRWTALVRATPALAACLGYTDRSPSVSTRYAFAYRLYDGPPGSGPRPSDALRHRKFLRILKSSPSSDALTDTLSETLRATLGPHCTNPLPETFAARLQLLLGRIVLEPSVTRGFFQDPVDVSGDGSLQASHGSGFGLRNRDLRVEPALDAPRSPGTPASDPGASPPAAPPNGEKPVKKAPKGKKQTACPAPAKERWYSDPQARWGYCASKDEYIFGYRLHVLMIRKDHQDLPICVSVANGATSDVQMGMEDLCQVVQYQRQEGVYVGRKGVVLDKGYDSLGMHAFLGDLGLTPLIPLRDQPRAENADTVFSKDGRPLCPAGVPMRWHGFQKKDAKHVYNCPVKRPGRENGKQVFRHHPEECPNQQLCDGSQMGPCVTVYPETNVRLHPPLPRHTEEFKERYKARTSTERFFSWLEAYPKRPYRRGFLFGLLGLGRAILAWVQAWQKQDAALAAAQGPAP